MAEQDYKALYEKERRLRGQETRRADLATRRADKAVRATRKTTLKEYLEACQKYVLSKIVLDTDGYLTTRTPSTNPSKKLCPDLIRPWRDFVETQVAINERIDRIIPHGARLFENVAFLELHGQRVHRREVHREADLTFVHNNAIEDPVRIIIDEMKNLHPEREGILLHAGVHFQTTAENLRDVADTPETRRDMKLLTDQICVLRGEHGDSVAYIIEYKAPRRLHTMHLEKGLRPMSIVDDVVNKPTIPNFDPEKSQHYAELLTAAVIAQTYNYMLEAGLEYGCIANGEALVFLKIDWNEPTVLLYHLAQPSREVQVNDDAIYSNAVCQMLAFTILALQSQQRENGERLAAMQRCKTWKVDFNDLVEKLSTVEDSTTSTGKKRRRAPSSPEWLPSPIKKTRRGPRQQSDSESDSESEQEPQTKSDRVLRPNSRRDDPGSGSGGGMSSSGHGSGSGRGDDTEQHSGTGPVSRSVAVFSSARDTTKRQPRPYCTPLCLLSLVHGRALDRKCPNATLHRRDEQSKAGKRAASLVKHPVSYTEWMSLLREQLSKGLEEGVVGLKKEGSCGVLFQITLLQYGYTFVAKGGAEYAIPMLKHEEAVYERLQALQGRYIPVHVGSVDLRPLNQMYFYKIGIRLVYFLLMSYGGTAFEARPDAAAEERLVTRLKSVVDEMHSLGVVHGDIRLPNVLHSPTGSLTVIDFDHAQLLPSTEYEDDALSDVSLNKRKRSLGHQGGEDGLDGDGEDAAAKAKQTVMASLGRRQDCSNANSIFTWDLGRHVGWPKP